MAGDAPQRLLDMLAQRQLLAGGRVHIGAVQTKAAGLEAVIGIDQIVVFAGFEGLLTEEPGAQRLNIVAGTAITLLMVTSSYCIACSVNAIRQDKHRAAVIWLVAGLIIALGYPVAKVLEIDWNLAHGINGESGIFFTVYYYLTFTHMVHAFWGILGILWVLTRHSFGIYTADEHSGLEALASYWHATDIIWLVIFPFFYVLA